MKAFVRTRYGPPDVLELRDVERPSVGPDDVLVRVRASSLNMGDLDYLEGRPAMARIATGLRQPRLRRLGLDLAGDVEAVGSAVTGFRPGDAVFGDMTQFGHGAFAEYVMAPAPAFAPKPVGSTYEEAACVPQAGILALQGLRGKRPIAAGQRVLINGASGSVGPFAIQIAKSVGAEVTGVCSPAKMDLVRSLGADHVIDYTREDFSANGKRYHRILDVNAQHSVLTYRRSLTPDGVYVWIGGFSATRFIGAAVVGPLLSLGGGRQAGIMWWWRPMAAVDVADLSSMLDAGAIRPVIDRTLPLDQVPDGLRYLAKGKARGKVVIAVQG